MKADVYFCVSMNGKALCFIFNKGIGVLKGYNIAEDYSLKLKVHKLCWSSEKVHSGGLKLFILSAVVLYTLVYFHLLHKLSFFTLTYLSCGLQPFSGSCNII
jgi:hypothetical protein